MTAKRSLMLSSGFLLFLLAVAAVAWWIGTQAQSAILQSQAGEVSSFSVDPNEPGFRAFTTTTETVLVLHTAVRAGVGAELVGVTLLSGGDGGGGGTAVTIPRTFVDPGSSGVPLAELFAADGLDAVLGEMRSVLGIGFSEVVVLDASSWTGLMIADLPLTLTLRNDLVQAANESTADGASPDGTTTQLATEVLLAAGTRDFDLTEIALVAGHRNPAEPGLAVALRQQQVWRAWISRTAGADERPELFEQETGFAKLIGTLASGEVAYRTIDTVTIPAEDPEATLYEAQGEPIADLVAQIVPFPESASPGDRPTVLLLDPAVADGGSLEVISAIARSGGLVTILGNAETGVALEPEVQVHDPLAAEVAEEIADRLGYPMPRIVPLEDATTSITVIAR